MIYIFICILLFMLSPSYAHEAKQGTEVKHEFLLKPEITPYALTRIVTTPLAIQKSISIWLLDGDKMSDYKGFIASLSHSVGVCVSPFDEASPELVALARTQGRDVALIVNTQTRLDGDACSAACFNATSESIAFFQHFIDAYKIKTIFLPDITEIDVFVLMPLIDFAKKNKLHVLLPPQLFGDLATLCQKNNISYCVLTVYAPNNFTFNVYKQHLTDSLNIDDMTIAISASDMAKKAYLQTYLEVLATKQIMKK